MCVNVCKSTYLVTGNGTCLLIKINDPTDFPHSIKGNASRARLFAFSPFSFFLFSRHASIDFLMVYCSYKRIKCHSTTYWRRHFLRRYHKRHQPTKEKISMLNNNNNKGPNRGSGEWKKIAAKKEKRSSRARSCCSTPNSLHSAVRLVHMLGLFECVRLEKNVHKSTHSLRVPIES